ncbi:MAG: restriction endonuclease subunit S [Candidatus Saccharibacteria bacterium]|nr:restriction endonuclease subunit S [Rhodoferax sp.]
MKATGAEAIGHIPTTWSVLRLKDVLRQATTLRKTDATQYVGLEQIAGWNGTAVPIAIGGAGLESAQLIRQGAICFSKLRPYLAKALVAETDLIVTSELLIARPLRLIESAYLLYWLLSHRFIFAINDLVAGTKMPRVDWATFAGMPVPLPKLMVQRRIANWLDLQTTRIDKRRELLGRKRSLLSTLKTTIISEATSRGVDRTAVMKSSGSSTVGLIPKHWHICRLKELTSKIGSGKTPLGGSSIYSPIGVAFLRSQNVWDDGIRLDDVVYISDQIHREMNGTKVKPGDILLNITGASIGRSALVPETFPEANVSQHVCIIRLRNKSMAGYVALTLLSQFTKAQMAVDQVGAARDGLNFENIGRLPIPLPPSEAERKLIVSRLENRVSKIARQITLIDQLDDLLKQQRKAIIHEAVTGKIDLSTVLLAKVGTQTS